MDFPILYAIQGLRTAFLDSFFVTLSKIAGDYGHIWVILGIILLFFKKTRKCGITMISSYLLVFVVGQFVLKDLIARPRPCQLDTKVPLLVKRPSSFSCPSTHAAWAFAASTSVFVYHKGWGALTGLVALLIAFSRLYLFVHFPTDVLFGMALGILLAFICFEVVEAIFKKKELEEKKQEKDAAANEKLQNIFAKEENVESVKEDIVEEVKEEVTSEEVKEETAAEEIKEEVVEEKQL